MPKISLAISQDRYNNLISAFAKDGKLSETELETMASLALEAWADTLLGITRYRSMTELYINWLRDIFQHLLSNEDPDEKTLVTRLNLPYGQAAYIARVLREENTVLSRKRWLERLKTVLTKRLPEAKEWEKKGSGEETMEFYMHKYARRELSIILSRLLEKGQPTRQIKVTSTVGDYIFLLIVAADIEKIVKEISDEIAHLKS